MTPNYLSSPGFPFRLQEITADESEQNSDSDHRPIDLRDQIKDIIEDPSSMEQSPKDPSSM